MDSHDVDWGARPQPNVATPEDMDDAKVEAIIAKPTVEPVERTAGHSSLVNSKSPCRNSRIQDRWVRKTELRPGERWKRRLCDAAR